MSTIDRQREVDQRPTGGPHSATSARAPAISIVVPVYNEEENVRLLWDQIRRTAEALERPFEVVFVDDGSSDSTFEILSSLHRTDRRLKAVRFRRNYGQTAAMAAGFDLARGAIIVSMDGDLQNDPADIPPLLAKLDDGFDVVCGWRKDRKDKFWTRRVPSVIANWIIGRITGVHIHDNGCSLKAYRAPVIKNVRLYGEMHRFIPAMSTLANARIAEIVVNHHPRRFGTSKYGLARIWRVMLDIIIVKMITRFGSRPSRWFGGLSVPVMLIGATVLAAARLGGRTEVWLVGATTALLILFLGAYLLSLGVIGELVAWTGVKSRTVIQPLVESVPDRRQTDAEERGRQGA